MAVKRFEPFTSAVVLLVQQLSDSQLLILKLADRRLGYCASNHDDVDTVPWLSSIDDHLRLVVRDIQEGLKPNWFELIHYFENRPDTELWEDWMWEVCTWIGKMSSHDTELSAYLLLHRLQGRYIPVFMALLVFASPPSLFLFIPSPTSSRDLFLSISLVST